jgi:hypothetical protein
VGIGYVGRQAGILKRGLGVRLQLPPQVRQFVNYMKISGRQGTGAPLSGLLPGKRQLAGASIRG